MNGKFLLIPLTLLIIVITPQAFAENEDIVVVLETTSGDIVIEFFPDHAPNNVDNFLKLTKDGVYDGTIFHRIISEFMIQGGDPLTAQAGVSMSAWGTGDPGYKIDEEFNDISHERGIVSIIPQIKIRSYGPCLANPSICEPVTRATLSQFSLAKFSVACSASVGFSSKATTEPTSLLKTADEYPVAGAISRTRSSFFILAALSNLAKVSGSIR